MASSDVDIKIIPGTRIIVDGFRVPNKDQYDAFFLTHFHSDHYTGITKQWKWGQIYCSRVTGNLLKHKFALEDKWIQILEMDTTYELFNGVKVTLIDANHCPGSCLILFELDKRNESYLHTGDFRFDRSMLQHSALRPYLLSIESRIHEQDEKKSGKKLTAIYLDTTYCHPSHLFPRQSHAIDTIAHMVHRKMNNGKRTLFLVGTYSVGKERILERISRVCGIKIFVNYQKWRLLKLLELPYFDEVFTTDVNQSNVHVVSMFHCGWKKLADLLRMYGDRYDEIVAIKPTGWSFSGTRSASEKSSEQNDAIDDSQQMGSIVMSDNDDDDDDDTYHSQPAETKYTVNVTRRGKLTVCQVPYSEHSAFYELKEFVECLNYSSIVPTVYRTEKQRNSMLRLLSNEYKFDWRSVNNTLQVPDIFYETYVPRRGRQQQQKSADVKKSKSMSILGFFKNAFSSTATTTITTTSTTDVTTGSGDSVGKRSITSSTSTSSEISISAALSSVAEDEKEMCKAEEVIDLDSEDFGLQVHIMSSIEKQRNRSQEEVTKSSSRASALDKGKRKRSRSMGSTSASPSKRTATAEVSKGRRSMSILSFMRSTVSKLSSRSSSRDCDADTASDNTTITIE